MRSILAFVLGIAVTVGAAYVHDREVSSADKQIVNWGQLGASTRNALNLAQRQWNRLTER